MKLNKEQKEHIFKIAENIKKRNPTWTINSCIEDAFIKSVGFKNYNSPLEDLFIEYNKERKHKIYNMANDFKFKVSLVESERGWGQKIDEVKEFDSYAEAEKFIKDFNSQNNEANVPDWYMYAEAMNFKLNTR